MNHSIAPLLTAFRSATGGDLLVVASVFTPYQLLFFERLWEVLRDRPLFVLDSRPERYRLGRPPRFGEAVHIESLPLTGKVNDPEQAVLVRRGIEAAERFVDSKPFAFVCGSYQWSINSAFYYRHRDNSDCSFFLSEEGLSSYLDIRPSRRERWRDLVRETVSRLRGFPPRPMIQGHPLGHDLPELKGIILGIAHPPEGGTRQRPFLLLPPDHTEGMAYSPDAALLIGQPYVQELGEARLAQLAATIHQDLARRGFRRIAFKPHHFQLEAEVAIYTAQGFDLINPPLAVEEMIPQSEFRTLAGFNSTALLTAKSLFGDSVHAIAYDPSRIVPRHEGRNEEAVEAIFREAGVEIIRL